MNYIKADFIGTLLAIYGAYDGEFPQNKNNPAFRRIYRRML